MKKSLVILILLVAGVSTALAHSLYQSVLKSHASSANQTITLANCQDYQAKVRVGGVIKATSGKACRLADGSWRVYPAGQHAMSFAGKRGGSGSHGLQCQRGQYHSRALQSKQLEKFLNDIHGWNKHQDKPLKRFKHPQIKPGQKYHKKLQQQPLLVDSSQGTYQYWH